MDISASDEEEDVDGEGRLAGDAKSPKALAHQGAKGTGPDATDYESDIARAQIYAMAAGDAQSLADAVSRYVLMMDHLCDNVFPAEGHRVEQRLTREVTERMLLLAPAQYEVTEKPAGQPIELNPACTDHTPLQVDKPEGHDAPTGENCSIGVTFIEGAEPQPLFAQPFSGCMKADIPLLASFVNAGDGADVSVAAVVDSG
eukprot:849950-Pleurochrysis_carterae.AAC.4